MKEQIKPTQEEKEQYFAAHWLQRVLVINAGYNNLYHINHQWISVLQDESHLELTSLADITDEDAIEVAKIYKSNVRGYGLLGAAGVVKEEFLRAGKEFCKRLDGNFWNDFANILNMLAAFDFLRSKGYALPWRRYTVEHLISLGWLKLRQKGDNNNG